MSSKLNDDMSVGGGAVALPQHQAPRLPAGGVGYASWKEHMDVYLQRAGAEDIHKEETTAEEWRAVTTRVASWAKEEYDAALALVVGTSVKAEVQAAASSGPVAVAPSPSAALSPEVKAARKLVASKVERSRRVFGILYAALPDELKTQTAHITQGWAYGLWHWLETKYQSTEEDAVGDLFHQWSMLRQEDGQSFDAYRAKVNKLRDLLKAAKEEQSARMYAHMLLDRLLPRYKQAVLALKAGGQLKDAAAIDWDLIAVFINAHERNEARLDGDLDGSSAQAMAATADRQPASAGSAQYARSRQGNRSRQGGHAAASPRDLSEIQCFLCMQYGHFKSDCPDASRQNTGGGHGSKRRGGGGRQDRQTGTGERAQRGGKKPSFAPRRTTEQAKAAQTHGDRNRYDSLSDGSSEDENPVPTTHKARTYAAIVINGLDYLASATSIKAVAPRKVKVAQETMAAVASSTTSTAKTALTSEAFGIDTMASIHASGNKAIFVGPLKKCPPVHVQMADGNIVTTKYFGTVIIKVRATSGKVVKMPIEKVHYHERFSTNLLSWSVLREVGWALHSDQKETFVRTPGGNKIQLLTAGRVSMLNCQIDNATAAAAADPQLARTYALGELTTPNVEELVRLHERLGHMGFKRMVLLIKGGAILDVTKVQANRHDLLQAKRLISACKACILGKGTRTAFGHRGLDVGTKRGEVLHMDTYEVRRRDGDRKWVEYGLTVTDPFTQWRWFESLSTKDEAAKAVIRIIRHAQKQFGCKVKRLRADGGGEFINKTLRDWCESDGIKLHHTPARTQQLNGVAENGVRSVKDSARTLLMHAQNTPLRFWARAAAHATYVWNRSHVSRHSKVTPYQAMYGKKPSMRHWGIFGTDGFAHVPKQHRGALDAKKEPCIYLGHDEVQNCAKVYLLGSGNIVATRDVTYTDAFTYVNALCQGRSYDVLSQPTQNDSSTESDGAHDDASHEPAATEEHDRYEVDAVIDQRTTRNGGKEYLVRWTNYEGEDSWQPADQMLADAPDAVRDFLRTRGVVADDSPVLDSEPANQPAADDEESDVVVPPSDSAAGAPEIPSIPAPEPLRWHRRRSPRDHLSSRSLDRDDAHQVHMAMCAISDVQSTPQATSSDEMICAVSAGVSLLESRTPATYRKAVASPDAARWKEAMEKEFAGCEEKDVWELVDRKDLPPDANILPVKWVYRMKTDETGAVTQFKARITPKGFRQKEGRDYFEVFARTGMYKTLRVGLSLAAKLDYEIEQLDIPQAFLNADVDEEVFMEVPEGFREGREGKVLRLKKSLYGLRQAPRNWDRLIHGFIVDEMHFKESVSDPCLFFRRSRSGRLMLIFLFVDDFKCQYHREDLAEWHELRALLIERFQAKVMGEAKYILGMTITRDRKAGTITLDQELYITKSLEKYGFAECRTAPTPEVVGAAHQTPSDKQAEPTDRQRYMEIVGTLMYAAISTRPDITHAVYYLAAHMVDPRKLHMDAAERVLRYLAGTRSLGLVFGSRNSGFSDSRGHTQLQVDVCAYADADWANDKSDRRSVTGWVAKVNGDPISWSSKKQRTVALSTCEAELYAEAEAIREVLWLRGLVKELGLRTAFGSVVHSDNQSAIAVSKNGVKSERTKHVDVKYHFVTEVVERGDVQLKWVPSAEQHADIFTKALPVPQFEQLREQLMAC